MIRRTEYLTQSERRALDLTCSQTLARRKERIRRLFGFLLPRRFRFGS